MKTANKIYSKYKSAHVSIKASFWFFVCSFLQKAISAITTPIFTRLLSTYEYGKYNVFNSWMNILFVVFTLNACRGIYTQGLIKFEDKQKIFSSSLQGLTFVLIIVWGIIYTITCDKWTSIIGLDKISIYIMIVTIWLNAVFTFWATEQRVLLKYRHLVIISIGISVLKPLLSIILILNLDNKVHAYLFGNLIADTIIFLPLFFKQIYAGKVIYNNGFWVYAIKLCIPLLPHYLSQTILNGADKIMIERLVGLQEAGIYSLAYSVSLLMTMVNTALHQTINPWIYRKIKNHEERKIASIAEPTLLVIAFANLFLILVAPEVVYVFAPKEYMDAIWVIPPVSMSVLFMFAYSLFADFEFYYEKTVFISVATILSSVLNILFNYIFIPIFGYYAAGYTTLFCYILYTVGHYCFMRFICRIQGIENVYNTKLLMFGSLVFIATGILISFTYTNKLLRLIIAMLIMVVIIGYRKRIRHFLRETFERVKNEN